MMQPTPRRSPVGALLVLVVLVGAIGVAVVVGGRFAADWLEGRGESGAAPGAIGTPHRDTTSGDDEPVRPGGVASDAEAAQVVHVVDGDTIHVVSLGSPLDLPSPQRERVRLLNIDTPELQHPERGRECGAGTATDRLVDLLDPPAIVWMAADVEERDRFDRALRYIWSADGVDVQATLVEEGLAEALVIRPNDRFARPLFELESDARTGGLGIWGPSCLD